MTTAIDTNVIVALWDAEDSLHRPARAALDKAFNEGTLVISGAVYAELLGCAWKDRSFCRRVLRRNKHRGRVGTRREGVAGGGNGLPGLRSTATKTEGCRSASNSSRFLDWGACACEQV